MQTVEYDFCAKDFLSSQVSERSGRYSAFNIWRSWANLNQVPFSTKEKLCLSNKSEKAEVIEELLGQESFQKEIGDALNNNLVSIDQMIRSLGVLMAKSLMLNATQLNNLEIFMVSHGEFFDELLKESCSNNDRYTWQRDCIKDRIKKFDFIPLSALSSAGGDLTYREMMEQRPEALLEIAQFTSIDSLYASLSRQLDIPFNNNRPFRDGEAFKAAPWRFLEIIPNC